MIPFRRFSEDLAMDILIDKAFYIHERERQVITYRDLFRDLENMTEIPRLLRSSNPYEIFLSVVRSLIAGTRLELIDHDMSTTELQNLGIDAKNLDERIPAQPIRLPDFGELVRLINFGKENWSLGLFTSGTTGRPKRVLHSFENLTRSVRFGPKYFNNVWGFCYNPSHMAGIQVFFQALLNGNTIVYLFDEEKRNVPELIKKYEITNLSATPTFYRTILPWIKEPLPQVTRVTLGGEKYDPVLEKSLRVAFPNAKITNIYASTEAGTLLVSSGEEFAIPPEMNSYLKIAEDGELLIHKHLLGKSEDLILQGEWYHTGDIVEVTQSGSLKFVARKTEMINVGGYKVNPHEVEEEIKKVPGVIDAYVYSRANRITGNIVVADVVKSKDSDADTLESLIYTRLAEALQSWKIPRIINFVEALPLTRTGKKVRQ